MIQLSNKDVHMSNDERIYWSVIAISLWVIAYAFWVFSMEAIGIPTL